MKANVRWSVVLIAFTGLLARGGVPAPSPASLAPLGTPRVWSPVEFRIETPLTTANNYDPGRIALDAEFTGPSGGTQTVPAFWFQDFVRGQADGGETLSPVGQPGWRLRYTPTEAGTYAVVVKATVAGQPTATVVESRFEVAGAMADERHGWVGIAADRRYLQTSDGRPLRLIGENLCWPEKGGTRDYDRWFQALHDSGENCARLWVAPWWAAIEQDADSLTRYRQDACWQLDQVFAAARRERIYLILCLDFHGRFQTDNPAWGGSGNYWPKNPYNAANDGPCRTPNEFFTDGTARVAYEKRLRYLIARYGANPHLLAWQFFNEIDNVFEPRGLRAADVIAWHRDVGRWLKAHDPYGHLVTTSLTGGSDREQVWNTPELEIAVYHSYDESAPARSHAALAADFHRRYGKPVLIGEFGVDSLTWAHASDPCLRGLRQSLWGGAVGGAAGTPLAWWWNEMDRDNVYPVFAAMSALLRRAGWDTGDWQPASVEVTGEAAGADGPALYSGVVNLNRQLRARVPGKVHLLGPLTAQRAFESASSILRGKEDPAGTQSLELRGAWAAGATFAVHIRSVMGAPDLVGYVDGRETVRRSMPTPHPALPYRQPVDETLTVSIPPGDHTVRLAIATTGWTVIDRSSVTGLVTQKSDRAGFAPEAIALRTDDRALAYVVSPWTVYPAGALEAVGPVQRGHVVTLPGWAAGTYGVEWFDPASARLIGSTEVLAVNGALRLNVPDYTDDLVTIVRRR